MVEPSIPLTALSQAYTRFTLIRPALEEGVSQAEVACTHHISKSTIGRRVKRYREIGLAGLADVHMRSEKGKAHRWSAGAITLIEGLALQTPPRTIAAIHRQVCAIARDRGWNTPSCDSVSRIIRKRRIKLLTLAHQGSALSAGGHPCHCSVAG
jgi:transposase-like protein